MATSSQITIRIRHSSSLVRHIESYLGSELYYMERDHYNGGFFVYGRRSPARYCLSYSELRDLVHQNRENMGWDFSNVDVAKFYYVEESHYGIGGGYSVNYGGAGVIGGGTRTVIDEGPAPMIKEMMQKVYDMAVEKEVAPLVVDGTVEVSPPKKSLKYKFYSSEAIKKSNHQKIIWNRSRNKKRK